MNLNYKIILNLFVSVFTMLQADLYASSNTINQLQIEEGFNIEIFVENIDTPRQMAESDNGNIFVGSRSGGTISVIDKNKNIRVIAKDLSNSTGVTYHDGDLYFSEVNSIWKISDIDNTLKNTKGILRKELVTNNLPSDTWHGWKWIDFGPDEKLYVPVGAPCNICNPSLEEEYGFDDRYASIMRLNEGEWEFVARGVRNTVGFDWHPKTNKLYFSDNGRDWLGDDSPSCELNVINEEGDFFGYPYKHAKNVIDPEYGHLIPTVNRDFVDPIAELGPHVAPLGIAFYDQDTFPDKYKNSIFVALHGSWNRTKKSGYKVVFVQLDDKGNYINQEDFITGWLSNENAWGRPVSPLVMKDGTMLLSDDKHNVIYRISYKG